MSLAGRFRNLGGERIVFRGSRLYDDSSSAGFGGCVAGGLSEGQPARGFFLTAQNEVPVQSRMSIEMRAAQ